MERACVTLDAIRKSRIGEMKIRGKERKKPMAAYDEEAGRGEVVLIHGRIEMIVECAAEIASLSKRNSRTGGSRGSRHNNAQER